MRFLQRIGVALFVGMLIVPSVLWFGVVDDEAKASSENRVLLPFPDLAKETWGSLFPDLDAWYEDNVPFKGHAVRLQNEVDAALFGAVSSDRAVLGEDGWLFYSRVDDGNPIAEYKGTQVLSDDDMRRYAGLLRAAEDNLASQDIELYVLVAPNKEIVYRQHMPGRIRVVSGETRAGRLADYLQSEGLSCFRYLLDAETGREMPTYYQLDTHWNAYGAYLGYVELLDMMGVESPSDAPDFSLAGSRGGDLAGMLNLDMPEGNNVVVSGDPGFEREGAYGESIEVFRSTRPDADPRTMLVVSDSFRNGFKRFPAQDFSQVVTLHRSEYGSEEFKQLGVRPDVVVLLSPERLMPSSLELLVSLATVSY